MTLNNNIEAVVKNFKTREIWYFIFVLPALAMFIFSIIIPVFKGFVYSFTDWDGFQKTFNYVGLKNFETLLKDNIFFTCVKNTFVFAAAATIFQNIAGLVLAVVLDTALKGKNVFRTIFFMPTVISTVLAGFIWSRLYSDGIPALFNIIGIKDITSPLGDPHLVIPAIVIIQLWIGAGNAMIIYIAGLQCIPGELYESAKVDGASFLQRFRKVTLPMLGPSLTINFVFVAVSALKVFDLTFIASSGGPGYASTSIAMIIYKTSYTDKLAGYGSAMAFVFFLILLTVALIQVKIFRKREVEL